MNINLTLLLQVAGVLPLGLMCAGLLMPQVVGMRGHLAALPPFIRQSSMQWVRVNCSKSERGSHRTKHCDE